MLRLRSATRLLSVIIIIAVAEIISRFEPVLASVEPEPAPPLLEAPEPLPEPSPVSVGGVTTGGLVSVFEAATQFGIVLIVSVVVVTVPPKASARPVQFTVLPIVIPAGLISVPWNVELAPSVVAAVGVHQISQDEAPPAKTTTELADVVNAPSIRKM
jgi:hypothetical protein